mmetsp:Transcript_29530/g.63954  ORF Transcript_29530/g.63954 Transcript_29530/m.63954 type:complete len:438 (+) Transcript_29530:168-1481(+)
MQASLLLVLFLCLGSKALAIGLRGLVKPIDDSLNTRTRALQEEYPCPCKEVVVDSVKINTYDKTGAPEGWHELGVQKFGMKGKHYEKSGHFLGNGVKTDGAGSPHSVIVTPADTLWFRMTEYDASSPRWQYCKDHITDPKCTKNINRLQAQVSFNESPWYLPTCNDYTITYGDADAEDGVGGDLIDPRNNEQEYRMTIKSLSSDVCREKRPEFCGADLLDSQYADEKCVLLPGKDYGKFVGTCPCKEITVKGFNINTYDQFGAPEGWVYTGIQKYGEGDVNYEEVGVFRRNGWHDSGKTHSIIVTPADKIWFRMWEYDGRHRFNWCQSPQNRPRCTAPNQLNVLETSATLGDLALPDADFGIEFSRCASYNVEYGKGLIDPRGNPQTYSLDIRGLTAEECKEERPEYCDDFFIPCPGGGTCVGNKCWSPAEIKEDDP